MDRCALFVDAGYLLADGAMAVHGTRHRETVSWDFGGLLQLLGSLARERTGMPLLRCYWYEATVEGRRNPEHDALADLPGLKLRLGRIRPGRREGVDTEIHRDLMTLARNSALTDAVLVSGDEDLAQVIADAQDFGVRVTVVHVAVDGNWTISRVLRQECDDLIEIGSGHLRPYVNMLTGMDGASSHGTSPLSNGHGSVNGHGSSIGPLQTTSHNGGPPPSSPLSGQPPATPSVRDLGPAMTGGLSGGPGTTGGVGPGPSAGTGPMPLPNGSGGGYSGSSYGTGGQQVPLQPAPAGPSSTQAPQAPAPSPSPPTGAVPAAAEPAVQLLARPVALPAAAPADRAARRAAHGAARPLHGPAAGLARPRAADAHARGRRQGRPPGRPGLRRVRRPRRARAVAGGRPRPQAAHAVRPRSEAAAGLLTAHRLPPARRSAARAAPRFLGRARTFPQVT
nr:NYN domain-containing protein [Actinomadura madurae]